MPNDSYHAVVYGPLRNKKTGSSLGVNVMPSMRESCPEDCIYCKMGLPDTIPIARVNQAPSPGVIVTSAARKIIEFSKAGEKIKHILVMGNSEPTLHPGFVEITENLRDLRDKWFPKATLDIHCFPVEEVSPGCRHALTIYDRPTARFDWGTAKTFASMTGEPATKLKSYQSELAQMDKLVVRATFSKAPVDNSTDSEVKSWLKKLREVEPKEVTLGTVERSKGKANTRPVTALRLEKIAAKVAEELEVPVSIQAAEAPAF